MNLPPASPPLASDTPASGAAPESPVPPGGFYFVVNAGSGRQDAQQAQAVIREVLEAAGHRCQFLAAADGADLPGLAQEALRLAQQHEGVIAAAGGDGTLNAVVQVALGGGRPFAMVPLGTFNYFARTHGIPQDVRAAAESLRYARLTRVQVGLVNDRVFLVNASIGLYPQLLEEREGFKQRFGRRRWIAFGSAVASLWRSGQTMPIEVEIEGERRILNTQSLFVGNNALQLEQVGIPEADAIGRELAVLMLRPVSRAGLFGLLLRSALSRLGDAESLITFPARELTVQPLARGRGNRVKLAVDGEITYESTPLVFRAAPQALTLLVPRAAPLPADGACA